MAVQTVREETGSITTKSGVISFALITDHNFDGINIS